MNSPNSLRFSFMVANAYAESLEMPKREMVSVAQMRKEGPRDSPLPRRPTLFLSSVVTGDTSAGQCGADKEEDYTVSLTR